MLAVAILSKNYEETVRSIEQAVGGESERTFIGSVGSATESISLATDLFASLPTDCQKIIKSSMEDSLRQFGVLLLAATYFSTGSNETDAVRAIQEGIDFMRGRIFETIGGEE